VKVTILGAALGQCVHIAGLDHFLRLAESEGFIARSLGPAVPVSALIDEIAGWRPDVIALSYRLRPQGLAELLRTLRESLDKDDLRRSRRFWFGGTPPNAEVARESGLFDRVFDGSEEPDQVLAFLRGETEKTMESDYGGSLVERIRNSFPYPLIRHHFGRPTVAETVEGAREIAEARVLDVLSIGPDQNAQEHFFRPNEMDPSQDGAGGVPLRKPDDLRAIYEATRTGNYPLVRIYSGTRDLIQWAQMSVETVHNAWAAIPLCWYSVMDGRSQVPFPEAIREKQEAMRWYAAVGIPVEVNESHQWSLRDAHDALAVTMAFLAAYNAKRQGVRHYVIQMMHNTPPGTSPALDLAKMLAKLELISALDGPDFETVREVRAGITSLPPDPDVAKGHLAASTVFAMALQPHIVHIVGFSEAHHLTTAEQLMESCRIGHGAIRLALKGMPDWRSDPAVVKRKEYLVGEARVILDALWRMGAGHSDDPWADATILTEGIQKGLLDAPHFRGNPHLFGQMVTRLIDGGWDAVDPETGQPLSEADRIRRLNLSLE
jgi:methylmalonyl-CoA mutase cobalamin-binding subunit